MHSGRFFIQRHNATRLHYDFRLEIDGTLKSWAVPKGPSLDPSVKHLAAMVEDHPLDYGDFEGNIPKGEYGGGSVMLWDRGTFELIGDESGVAQIARGDLKFELHGEKLNGTWAIVHMKNRGKGNEWLIIKKKDEAAQTPWNIEDLAYSVKTGRTQEEIAADLPAKKKTTRKKKAPALNPEKLAGAVEAPMPGFFAPMGANLTDRLPKGKDWIFEVKWDGVRGLLYIANGALPYIRETTTAAKRSIPSCRSCRITSTPKQAILDGEIVVLDTAGVSHFELIQSRIHNKDANAIAKMAQKNPVHLYVFDLLYLDGFDLRRVPLIERKRLLAENREAVPAAARIGAFRKLRRGTARSRAPERPRRPDRQIHHKRLRIAPQPQLAQTQTDLRTGIRHRRIHARGARKFRFARARLLRRRQIALRRKCRHGVQCPQPCRAMVAPRTAEDAQKILS